MFAWLVGITCRECGADYYEKDGYNSKFCSLDCKWENDERQEERRERKREKARERERQQEENKIKSEVESSKETSTRQIGSKYGIEISFTNKDKVNIISSSNGKIAHIKNHISELETENGNIENLIADLQSAKNDI